MGRILKVVPHNPSWKRLADKKARRITKAAGANILAVHHFGSSAIPGIKVEPTIYLLVEVRDILVMDRDNPVMSALGYEPRGEYGIPGQRKQENS